jgi:hypothetical protein
MCLHVWILLIFTSARVSESAVGNWTLLAGEMAEIQNDDGSNTKIPTMSGTALAKSTNETFAYFFGGIRMWKSSMNNYLYRMNIDSGTVSKISG